MESNPGKEKNKSGLSISAKRPMQPLCLYLPFCRIRHGAHHTKPSLKEYYKILLLSFKYICFPNGKFEAKNNRTGRLCALIKHRFEAEKCENKWLPTKPGRHATIGQSPQQLRAAQENRKLSIVKNKRTSSVGSKNGLLQQINNPFKQPLSFITYHSGYL